MISSRAAREREPGQQHLADAARAAREMNVDDVGTPPQLGSVRTSASAKATSLRHFEPSTMVGELRHLDLGRQRCDQRVLDRRDAAAHLQVRAEHQHAERIRHSHHCLDLPSNASVVLKFLTQQPPAARRKALRAGDTAGRSAADCDAGHDVLRDVHVTKTALADLPRANPSKGGDAKLPVCRTSSPTIAGPPNRTSVPLRPQAARRRP